MKVKNKLDGGQEMKHLVVDLFSGAGGMSEGILQAGFHIVFSSDKSSEVEKTYTNRHEQLGYIQGVNTHFERMDICDLTGEFILNSVKNLKCFKDKDILNKDNVIDVIFGGPPCQGFSRSGKRDPNDPRNFLFREYIRIISELKPKYVVMENVEGMLDMQIYIKGISGEEYENCKVPDILKKEFDILGYNTLDIKLLDASDYGVPQSRKRAIFMAGLKGLPMPKYPEPTHVQNKVTLLEAIGDLIQDKNLRRKMNNQLTEYQKKSKEGRTPNILGMTLSVNDKINHEFSNHTKVVQERFSIYRPGEDANAVRRRIKQEGIDISKYENLKKYILDEIKKVFQSGNIIDNEDLIKGYNNPNYIVETLKSPDCSDILIDFLLTKKNSRTKLDSQKPSLTVLTIPDDYISPFENRVLSVREMARLQSFDDSFEFLGKRTTGGERRKLEVPQYTQVGNAVPPLLARAVAMEIKRVLDN